jgi:hypothetical protein
MNRRGFSLFGAACARMALKFENFTNTVWHNFLDSFTHIQNGYLKTKFDFTHETVLKRKKLL